MKPENWRKFRRTELILMLVGTMVKKGYYSFLIVLVFVCGIANGQSLAPFAPACSNGASFVLTGGTPLGGIYSGSGVSGGQFDPSSVGPGTYTITYTVIIGGISKTATNTITVLTPPASTPDIISIEKNMLYSAKVIHCPYFDFKLANCNVSIFTGNKFNFCVKPKTPFSTSFQLVSPNSGSTYTWSIGSGAYAKILGSNSGTLVTIYHDSVSSKLSNVSCNGVTKKVGLRGFNWNVTLTEVDANGCSMQSNYLIGTIVKPEAKFSADTVCLGQPTHFTNLTADDYATEWEWDFGDGTSGSTNEDPGSHTYAAGGTYPVRLIAKSGCYDCSDTVVKNVVVRPTIAPGISTCNITACPNTTVTYSTTPGCSFYDWQTTNGTVTTGQGSNTVTVDWANVQYGDITLQTSCSSNGCPPSTIQIPILTSSSVITGVTKICTYSLSAGYTMPSFPGANYTWTVSSPDAVIISGQGSNNINVDWSDVTPGNYQVNVHVTHPVLPCENNSVLNVQVLDKFDLTGVVYSSCLNNSPTYKVDHPGTFNWEVVNGTVTSGQGTNAAVINWNSKVSPHIVKAKPTGASVGAFCNDSVFAYVQVDTSITDPTNIIGPLYVCPNSLNKYTVTTSDPTLNFTWTAVNGAVSTTSGTDAFITWGATGPYSLSVVQSETSSPFCSSQPFTINVNDITTSPPPIIGPSPVCVNDKQTYSVVKTKGATYAWSITPAKGSIIKGQGTNAITVLYTTAGAATISVTTTLCPGLPVTVSLPVVVNALPVAPIVTQTGEQCDAGYAAWATGASLSVSGGYASYSWNDGSTTQTIGPKLSGTTYIVVVRDVNGCSAQTGFKIDQKHGGHAEPSTSDSIHYCTGDPINTTFWLTGPSPYATPHRTYEWFKDGVPIGVDSGYYVATAPGKYTIVRTTPDGCISGQIGDAIIDYVNCNGGEPNPPCPFLPPLCTGHAPYPKGTTVTIVGNGVTVSGMNIYNGGGNNNGAKLSQQSLHTGDAEIFDVPTTDLVLCDDTAQFQCTTPGAVAWYWDFGDGTSSTAQNPLKEYVTYIGYRKVTCYVMYADSSWNSVSMNVVSPLTVRIDVPRIEHVACNTLLIPNNSKWTYNYWGVPPTSFLWDYGDGTTSTAYNPAPHVYPGPGTYKVTLTGTQGVCTQTRFTYVTIDPPEIPKINIANVCQDTPIQFKGTTVSGADSVITYWSWDFGDGYAYEDQSPLYNYSVPGTYNVKLTISDAGFCTNTVTKSVTVFPAPTGGTITASGATTFCQGGSVDLTATAAASYLWSNGSTLQTITVNATGTYVCTITDSNGCTETLDPIDVIVKPAPKVSITASGTLCAGGGSINLYAPYGATSYQWFNNGAPTTTTTYYTSVNSTGLYSVVVTNSYGCTTSAVYLISTVKPGITSVSVSGNLTICAGNSTTLTGNVVGGTAPIAYKWSENFSAVSTAPSATFSHAAFIQFTATDADGCSKSTYPGLTVNPKPVIPNFPSGCFEICYKDTFKLTPPAGIASYQWLKDNVPVPAPAGTNPSLIITGDGVYKLITTSAAGCTDTTENVNLVTKPLPVVNAGQDLAMCFASGESVTLDGSGTGTYSWTPGTSLSSTTVAGPVANPNTTTNYILTVTGINGCRNKDTMEVKVICTQPVVSVSSKSVCVDSCAVLTAKAAGGAAPYTYTWSTGQTGPGPYTICTASTETIVVSVTDNAAKTDVTTATITVLPQMTFTPVVSNLSCTITSGSALVSVNGSTAPYSYSWNTGSNVPSIFNVLAGTYSVTATDSKGCVRDTVIKILQTGAISSTYITTAANCGATNGSISITPTGGIAPYNYSWSNGTTAATGNITGASGAINLLSQGSYSLTVTDASSGGCSTTSVVSITNSSGQTSALTLFSQPKCVGAADGVVTLSITGGSPTYSYTLSDGVTNITGVSASSGITIPGLAAATYTVTVKDNNGCVSTSSLLLNQPAALAVSASQQTSASCGQSNGSAFASASGGTGSFSYSWNNGMTSNTATNLSGGIYTVTATDNNGCSQTQTVNIGIGNGPTAVATIVSAIPCNGETGQAGVTVTGGNNPYTYSWSTGISAVSSSTSQQVNNLIAGIYSVTITDGIGCTSTATINFTEPSLISTPTIAPADAGCSQSNGAAVASASSGGTGTLTFSWSSSATGLTASNLSAGTYILTVSDGNNCSVTTSTNISNTGAPALTNVTPQNILCNGNNTGSISVSISGGSAPYTYSWSSGVSSSTSAVTDQVNNLGANLYTVTITDAGNCQAITTITITEPSIIVPAPFLTTNTSCGQSNGTAVAAAVGGVGNLSYNWSEGTNGATAINLAAAIYTVTITDANFCTKISTVTIINTNGPAVTMSVGTAISCFGGTGAAVASVSGGGVPYTYAWSSGVSAVTSSLTHQLNNLISGNYSVTITDASGCSSVSTINLSEPAAITKPVFNSTGAGCGLSNGSVVALASGGTGILTYNWSNNSTGATANNLSAGAYSVTVTDGNNCSTSGTTAINNIGGPAITSIIPKPLLCFGDSSGSISIVVAGGSSPYTYSWSSGVSSVTNAVNDQLNKLPAANYTVTISDAGNCLVISTVALVNPPTINSVTFNTTAATCGQSDGTVIASTSGGTGSLNYSWSNLVTGATNTNIPAGAYIVTVTDANSCSATAPATINNANGPTVTTTVSAAIACFGGTGSITATASGGNSPYSYSWSTGASAVTANLVAQLSNLASGIYSVTITDASGCSNVSSIVFTQPVAITTPTFVSVNAGCGLNDGSAIASCTGGTGTLAYSWSNSTTGNTASNLSAGTYTLTVTDGNNCTTSQSVSINNSPAPLINSVSSTDILCKGTNSGTLSISASGTGTLGYTWSVSQIGNSSLATGLSAGNYTVTVTDANGCKAITNLNISEPANALSVSSLVPSNATCGKNNGSITVAASGGTGNLSYSWSATGNSGTIIYGLFVGTYSVTVTDGNGCSVTSAVAIGNNAGPGAATSVSLSIPCFGGVGAAKVTASAGSPPYTYSWSNGVSSVTTSLTSQISNLAFNLYTVTITDANGCSVASTVNLTQPQQMILTSSFTDAVCGYKNGVVKATASGGTPVYTYSWSNGINSITSSTIDSITNLPAGIYAVVVTDVNGCSSVKSDTVNSISANTIVVSPVQQTITEGSSVALNVSGGLTYTWSPPDGLSCINCPDPTAKPIVSTTYTITATDANGCKIVATINIAIKQACVGDDADVFIANIFSPNNDGRNDVLNIEGNGLTNIYWAIYDRWGNLLFETFDQTHGWDGTKNGNALEAGTYVYYLKATCIKTNSEIKLKGNVSIVK